MNRAEAAAFWDDYEIPFEHDVAIKGRRSGLTRGSAGNGRARDTVNHLWVHESFSAGRLSRPSDTYLCDPTGRPAYTFTEERYSDDDGAYVPPITCSECLDLMERWETS